MPEPSRVREFFDKQAGSLAKSAFHHDEMRARRLVHFANLPPTARVLDVGCGAGPLLQHLVRQGARAVGIDFSRAMLAHAAGSRAPLVQGAMEALPLADESFDVVVSRGTLHHVPAPDAAIWEMRRVLVPGGVIVIEDVLTHVGAEVAARHNELERLRDPAHNRMLSVSALTGLLEEAGIEVSAVEVVAHERELGEWLDVALAPESAKAELRRRFEADLREQTLGLHTRRHDRSILFDLRHAMVKGVKR